jgi:hypothetical protein
MQRLMKWLLCLLVLAGAAGLSGAWTSGLASQEGKPHQEGKPQKSAQKIFQTKGRGARIDAIKKTLPTLKTSLAEAIALAEKETGGKAYDATLECGKDKPTMLRVMILNGDKPLLTNVDPETKKVSIVGKKEGSEEKGEEETEEGEEEEGG